MKGNSFFQLGLNLVLYVAAPATFLVFFGMGRDSSASISGLGSLSLKLAAMDSLVVGFGSAVSLPGNT